MPVAHGTYLVGVVSGVLSSASWFANIPSLQAAFGVITIVCTVYVAVKQARRKDKENALESDRVQVQTLLVSYNAALEKIAELTEKIVELNIAQTERSAGCPVSRALVHQLHEQHKGVAVVAIQEPAHAAESAATGSDHSGQK